MTSIRLRLNGANLAEDVAPRLSLADFVRERHNLTATHLGCEHGVCGACTVLIDGEPARSCLMLAVACDEREVESLEGLAADPIVAALRDSFHRRHAVQCGFCTPGMLISARDLIRRGRAGSEAEIRAGLAGNLCRCTGYTKMIDAVRAAAMQLRATGNGAGGTQP
jgi:carbon-monoxide dehydrogenase small subunit